MDKVTHIFNYFQTKFRFLKFSFFFKSEEKRVWIVTLFFGAMMLFSVRTVMSVCALEISKEFNYDKTQMATLLSSFFYGYPLTQILGGYISDRIGGDLVIFYAGIFWGITTFLLPYVSILSDNKYYILAYITIFRCVTGGFQGILLCKIFQILIFFYFINY
jgi:ACS family sodium-dependent inorganic phosphate cotransporter-like MFS transporter 9